MAAKAATEAIAPSVAALRSTIGEVNMPTRAIAAVLLRARGAPVTPEELYTQSNEYGLFNSKRHFKHCLKMMKGMKRVQVKSMGPQYPGASRLQFSVYLTRRGTAAYTRYLGETPPLPADHIVDSPGLTDALDKTTV